MGVGNLFARPGYAEFFRALATDPATRHLVHVSRLDVGATAAAVNLGLTYRDCYYHLLASYDDGELSRFGPGAAHLHDLLHQAIDRGFKRFRFHHRRRTLQARLVRYRAEALRPYLGSDLARGACRHADARHATTQALDQADAGIVESAFSAGRAFIGSLAQPNSPLNQRGAIWGTAATSWASRIGPRIISTTAVIAPQA